MKKTLNTGIFLITIAILFFGLAVDNAEGQSQTFTSSGTFTVPSGITSLTVEAWGAGGGGSSISSRYRRGGGGGGGAYARSVITVTPGSSIQLVVGAGGSANRDGGSSTFGNNLVSADGGKGASNNSGNAGSGGSASSSKGDVTYNGGNGADAGNYNSGGGGGAAGSNGAGGDASGSTGGSGTNQNGGDGGTGVYYNNDGNNGQNYGGGGSGASLWYGRGTTGGSGADGLIIVSWTPMQPVDNNVLSYVNGVSGTICNTVNEHGTLTLTSPSGTVFSYIDFASYGTPDGSCPDFTIGSCNASTSRSVVESYLLGANSADIPAENSIFGDPCVGTFKRFYVKATYNEPLCSGSIPSTINGSVPTGGDGSYTYLWESSISGPSSGFAAAAGTNNQQNYSPSALNQTTWFRRTVTSSGLSITSPVVEITVKPVSVITWTGTADSDWNNPMNWCGGTPSSSNDVSIGPRINEPVISTASECKNITIEQGASLTINPAGSLNVTGTFSNNAGASGLNLLSDASGTASLLENTDGVEATVTRYISGNTEAWHLISSPVADQSISGNWTPSGTYGNGTGYDLYVWNEATNCWIYFLNNTTVVNWNTVHPETYFVPGKGYLYSVQAQNPSKKYAGVLNNGDQAIPVTAESTDAGLQGFNLVGNPYPSELDWQSATGWDRSSLVQGASGYDMWVWNPDANNYGVISSAGGTGTNGVTRFLAPEQGFFVRALTDGNMVITNDAKTTGNSASWFKKGLSVNQSLVKIAVESEDSTGSDEIQMQFGALKDGSGAYKLFSPVAVSPSLYMGFGSGNFSVRYLTDTVNNPEVPVMFKPGKDGKYKLKASFDKNAYRYVILEDLKTNTYYDLKSSSTYEFSAVKGDNNSRFVVHFSKPVANNPVELPVKIYTSGTQLVVDVTTVNVQSNMTVFDFNGRMLFKDKLNGNTVHYIPLNAKSQMLIVRLETQAGVITRKVMWMNR